MTLGDVIKEYREKNGISQRQFASMCGLSNGYISMLEKNCNPNTGEPLIPSLPAIKSVASAIGITLDDLLAKIGDMPVDLGSRKDDVEKCYFQISAHEKALIIAYRQKPDMQPAVDRLLGISDDPDTVRLYRAAKSTDDHPDEIVEISRERFQKIKNAPETDDVQL